MLFVYIRRVPAFAVTGYNEPLFGTKLWVRRMFERASFAVSAFLLRVSCLWLGRGAAAVLFFVWGAKWWAFGGGALGDMGCHMIDPIFWALGLCHPNKVEASSTKVNSETGPLGSIIHYHFPARGEMPPVKLTW